MTKSVLTNKLNTIHTAKLYELKNKRRIHIMYGYIYKTTNLINSKIYVGQHKADHFEPTKYIGSGNTIKNNFKEFGKNNFKCELLDICTSQENLDDREKYWIEHLNSTDPTLGYNKAKGGRSPCFFTDQHHSNEAKEKISVSRKNKICVNDGVNNIYIERELLGEYLNNNYQKGPKTKRILTKLEAKENFQKISTAKKGKFYFINDAQQCVMISKEQIPQFVKLGYHYGNKKTKSTATIWMNDGKHDYKISVLDVGYYLYDLNYNKGRITKGHTDEGRKRIAEINHLKRSGKINSLATRLKISASKRGHLVSIETRERISEALKGKSYYTEESHKKTIETKKRNNKPYPEEARERIRKHQLENNSIRNAVIKKACVIKDNKIKHIGEKNLQKYLNDGYKIYHKGDLKNE